MPAFWGARNAQQQEEDRKAQMSLDIYQRAYAESDLAMKAEARGDFNNALGAYRKCLQWIQSDPSRLMDDDLVGNETTQKLMAAIRTIEDHAKDRTHALRVIVDEEAARHQQIGTTHQNAEVPPAVQTAPMIPVFTQPEKLQKRTSFERDARNTAARPRRNPSPTKKLSESLRPQPKQRVSSDASARQANAAIPTANDGFQNAGHVGPNAAKQAASNAAMLAWPKNSTTNNGVYGHTNSGSSTSVNSRGGVSSRPESRNSVNRGSREMPRYTLTDEPLRPSSRETSYGSFNGQAINRSGSNAAAAASKKPATSADPAPTAQINRLPPSAPPPSVPQSRTASGQMPAQQRAPITNANAAAQRVVGPAQARPHQAAGAIRQVTQQAPVRSTAAAQSIPQGKARPVVPQVPRAAPNGLQGNSPAAGSNVTGGAGNALRAAAPAALGGTRTGLAVPPPPAKSAPLTTEKDVVGPVSKQLQSLDTDDQPLPEDKYARAEQALKNVKGLDETLAKTIINEIVDQGDEVFWDDIAGLDAAKMSLKETVVYPLLRPDLFSGLREPVTGMLLFGPPGTGKTMLARAVATQAKATFFSISASSLTSKYLGESEKLVRALFVLAKELSPSIIFVDEIDSLLSSRGEGEHESSRRLKTEFLIQWSNLAKAAAGSKNVMDSRVLVLAATNLPWAIDDAARRRFVRRQYIPLPEDSTRRQHLRHLIRHQKHTLAGDEIEELVQLTDGFSGSDLTALAKDAAMGPLRSLGDALLTTDFDKIRPMGIDDFRASLRTIRPSVGKTGLEEYVKWNEEFGSM